MSGREKPLILQNGMPIPQAYDKDLGDWTEYSTEHIKAIKAELALVKAELQTIKTNQLSGDQKVQLSGNIVETLTVFNGLALTGTDRVASDVIDINRFKNLRFYARNTHDSDLMVGVHLQPSISVTPQALRVYHEGEWKTTYYAGSVIQITDRIGSVIDLGSLYTFLNSIKGYRVQLHVTPLSAPTKGALSMWIVGEVR